MNANKIILSLTLKVITLRSTLQNISLDKYERGGDIIRSPFGAETARGRRRHPRSSNDSLARPNAQLAREGGTEKKPQTDCLPEISLQALHNWNTFAHFPERIHLELRLLRSFKCIHHTLCRKSRLRGGPECAR